uniref:Uncharacterized protein n=1 Tax=Populus trichocarpa TaxID=3694 RepID=A9PDU8_POPTR|nr:unknown [Populus trichocarpa]
MGAERDIKGLILERIRSLLRGQVTGLKEGIFGLRLKITLGN